MRHMISAVPVLQTGIVGPLRATAVTLLYVTCLGLAFEDGSMPYPVLLLSFLLGAGLVVASIVDWYAFVLPNILTIPLMLLGIAGAFIASSDSWFCASSPQSRPILPSRASAVSGGTRRPHRRGLARRPLPRPVVPDRGWLALQLAPRLRALAFAAGFPLCGRVGAMDCSTAPLTEPDLRARIGLFGSIDHRASESWSDACEVLSSSQRTSARPAAL